MTKIESQFVFIYSFWLCVKFLLFTGRYLFKNLENVEKERDKALSKLADPFVDVKFTLHFISIIQLVIRSMFFLYNPLSFWLMAPWFFITSYVSFAVTHNLISFLKAGKKKFYTKYSIFLNGLVELYCFSIGCLTIKTFFESYYA